MPGSVPVEPGTRARKSDATCLCHSNVAVIRRLGAELGEIEQNHDPFRIAVDEDSITHWTAVITGPTDTPFHGGSFLVDLIFPSEYPFVPPLVTFRTPIFHPNVSTTGAICLDILKPASGSWSPLMSVPALLLSIQSLMSDPNPDDPLNVEAAELYIKSERDFAKKAIEETRKYAARPVRASSQREDLFSHLQVSRKGEVIDEDDAVALAIGYSKR